MAILWQCKNHHYRSKYPIVSLQECFRILQFKSGHPVSIAVTYFHRNWSLKMTQSAMQSRVGKMKKYNDIAMVSNKFLFK